MELPVLAFRVNYQMKMKKVFKLSIVLVIIPTILFIPFCILILYYANQNVVDYSQDVIGTWDAFQYYDNGEMFVCDEEREMRLVFEVDTLSVCGSGMILENTDNTDYTWKSGVSLVYPTTDGEKVLFISFKSHGNMQIKTEDGGLTILLRKAIA